MKNADGTGKTDLLFSIPDRYLFPWSWSADGKILLAEATTSPLSMDIGVLSIEGDPERELILQEEHLESDPRISPDGRWLAYTFSESGQAEIYVRPFPDVHSGQWKVSNNGGISPLWSPDGDATMAVPVETEPTFKPGNPRVLFKGSYFTFGLGQIAFAPWDISPDGKRFLMLRETAGDDPTQQVSEPKINIVINWFEDLRQRVPTN